MTRFADGAHPYHDAIPAPWPAGNGATFKAKGRAWVRPGNAAGGGRIGATAPGVTAGETA